MGSIQAYDDGTVINEVIWQDLADAVNDNNARVGSLESVKAFYRQSTVQTGLPHANHTPIVFQEDVQTHPDIVKVTDSEFRLERAGWWQVLAQVSLLQGAAALREVIVADTGNTEWYGASSVDNTIQFGGCVAAQFYVSSPGHSITVFANQKGGADDVKTDIFNKRTNLSISYEGP